MKLRDKMVVWPANLDSTKTRKFGRKIPRAQALQSPRLEELEGAANALSLEHEKIPAKSRPRNWWEKSGYMVINKSNPKSEVLRSIASEVRKQRIARDKKS